MNKNGPAATLGKVGISHYYLLSTIPVSLEGEEAQPLLLTDKSGIFTRIGKNAGLYSPEEREAALHHHRAFSKNPTVTIVVDGVVHTVNDPEILLLNNHSVTRFASQTGWCDSELIDILQSLTAASQRIGETVEKVYAKVGSGEQPAFDKSTLTRLELKRDIDVFAEKTWMYMTSTVVPEIVAMIKAGKIDVMAAVTRINKGEPF